MRLPITLLYLTLFLLQLGYAAKAQKVSISARKATLEQIFHEIQVQTDYAIIYKVSDLKNVSVPNITLHDASLTTAMDQVLKNSGLTYLLKNKTIIIRKENKPNRREVLNVQEQISGKVLGEDGQPLSGVSVSVVGAQGGTSTNEEGIFHISVTDPAAKLRFSYIGYQVKEIALGQSTSLTVQMEPDNQLLDAVVVTALGFKEVKDRLGSTSSTVKASDIVRSGETGLINGLAGKAAGVQINRSSGDPGAGSNIQIRGQNTITGSNQPLVIIDGIPMSNSTLGDARGGVAQQSRLNDINPEDIESMQVLKGASAAGLWGSRAANGVIVITTKQGANDNKLNVNFSSTTSLDEVNRLHPLQSNYGQGSNGVFNPTSQFSWGDKIDDRSGGEDEVDRNGARFEAYNGKTFYPIIQKNSREIYNEERENAVFRTGTYFDNNLSLSGGNEKGNFYLGLGRLDQKGVFNGQSDYGRNTVRLNTSRKFNDFVTASARANYIKTSANRIQKGDNSSGLYIGMLRSSPDFDSRYWKGDYYASPTASAIPNRQRSYRNYLGASANPGYNDPLWSIHELTNLTEVERFLMSAELVIKPVDWFDLTTRGGIDSYNDRRVTNHPLNSVLNSGRGSYEQEIIKETENNLDIIGRVIKDISPAVSSTWILGFNVNDRKYHELGGTMNNFIMDDVPPNFSNSTYENNYPYNSESHRRTARLYATLNLGYREQLYLNLSGAGESGSTFGSASKSTFYYPSADIAWLFSQLPGLQNKVLSFGKLRGSYGIVGIQPEPYRNTTPFITASFGNWANDLSGAGYGGAYVESTVQGDPYLKPERKTEWEIGTDLRFFDNKLSVGYTYYQNKIVDLLLQVSAAGSTGFRQRYTNAGKMENKGMELDLNYNILSKNDFSWNVFANWSRNRNRVTDLAGTDLITFTGGALSTVARVGSAMSTFYGGAYQRNPDGSLALTSTGFPQLSTESQIIGDPNPNWRGGIGTDLSYKKVHLHVLLETFQGGDFYEGTRGTLYNFGTHADVGHEVALTQDLYNYAGNVIPAGSVVRGNIGDFGGGPVLLDQSFYTSIGSHTGQLAEQFVSDGSWTRIREISLGYDLNSPKFQNWSKLKSVNITVTARNPFLWTKISGIDPETNVAGVGNSRGVDYFNNPSTRSLVFSLKINY
ncbi:SusC/RagA family TonB-linked outer membrane protein [Olivibacter sp. XZL3]|uniref:SusC/RagA family TonB-linked outer membrane protein n=1 Tax=Olivibacter sp. XZL3 TaxID=1735116 RepID=UPI001981C7C9|nr:SusC/RagA family TonB-linked outer membrane protein [Olivibacter sp. XZL3]